MWCDDLVVFSTSSSGLQNSINNISEHFNSLGLSINTKKTKVMVFNQRGLTLDKDPNHSFTIGDFSLEVVNEYQYLGLKLKSSGTFNFAAEELYTKASHAYFSISNILYTHKKWPIDRALSMFDTIVSPVALVACELWAPLTIP